MRHHRVACCCPRPFQDRVSSCDGRRYPSQPPGVSAKSFATRCGGWLGSDTSGSLPRWSSHQPLSPQERRVWVRCRCAVDGNFRPEVALCGTSAHGNSPSSDLTDSDICHAPQTVPPPCQPPPAPESPNSTAELSEAPVNSSAVGFGSPGVGMPPDRGNHGIFAPRPRRRGHPHMTHMTSDVIDTNPLTWEMPWPDKLRRGGAPCSRHSC